MSSKAKNPQADTASSSVQQNQQSGKNVSQNQSLNQQKKTPGK